MKWPWSRVEKRQTADLLSAAVDQYIAAASSPSGLVTSAATGAAELAAGLLSRCLAMAEVLPGSDRRTSVLTPALLAQVGRDLIRTGESVWWLRVAHGRVTAHQAAQHDVRGHLGDWTYWLSLPTPSGGSVTQWVGAEEVLHFQWGSEPATPWRGISPLRFANLSARVLAETTAALGDETSGPRGTLMPLPLPVGDNTEGPYGGLQAVLARLAGGLAVVETAAAGHGLGRGAAPSGDYRPQRIGATPPPALIDQLDRVRSDVLGACGVPASMAHRGEGAGLREAFRQYLFSTVSPLGALLSAEAGDKLDAPVALNFDALAAADVQGRARAYASLVQGGMPAESAARVAGVAE